MSPARKLACALLAVAVVVSVVYATGAFTSTTADRSVDVAVAGYGAAFLSLQPSNGPNGKFASYGSNGALQVKIGSSGLRNPATGVNPDSTTVFKNVFTITNKGSQPVSVWITGGDPAVTFVKGGGTFIEGKAGAVTLSPGGHSVHIGLIIDTRGMSPGTNLLKSVTIHADPTVEGTPIDDGDNDGENNWPGDGNDGEDGDGNDGDSDDNEDGAASDFNKNNMDLSQVDTTVDPSQISVNTDVTRSEATKILLDSDQTGSPPPSSSTLSQHQCQPAIHATASQDYVPGQCTVGDGKSIREIVREHQKKLRERLTESIENVISFLKEHPALMGVITATMPQVAIGAWAYAHPAQARAFALGAVLGEVGMPDGALAVKQSNSVLYIVGWMALSAIPGVETLADIRDFSQNLYDKDWLEAGLDGAALAAMYGPTDALQAVQDLGKWITKAGSKADIVVKTISKYILPHLSDGRKLQVLDIMSDGAASSLRGSYSTRQIVGFAEKGRNLERIQELSKQYDNADLAHYFTRYDTETVSKMFKKVPVEDVGYYYHHGTDFDTVIDLRNMKVPAEDVRYYVKHDERLWFIKKLRKIGFKPEFIKKVYHYGRRTRQAVSPAAFYGVAHNYCNWQSQQSSPKYIEQCGDLPTSPSKRVSSSNTPNMTNATGPARAAS